MQDSDRIQPYQDNMRYWQYKGQPVMLLGGSETDHIFLWEDLKEHLDEIVAVGGNYVRCTMSQREGQDLKPHKLLPDGKFDLDQWNEAYWIRFENMLNWTAERDIIVQIEVWDRFDFSTTHWDTSPWNPKNNVNYSSEETGLDDHYPLHPAKDQQPFFHSIEGMPDYAPGLDLIRKYQEAFVANLLSYSLSYGHVLYCMNNETSTPAQWGQYWIEFIHARASELGVTVCATDMFDDAFRGEEATNIFELFANDTHYAFADISQVNSRNYNETHWERLLWLLDKMGERPRPSNHVKIYGSGYKGFGTGGPEDGVERFWRNVFGGAAGVRFHRPEAGNGLNDFAKASIQAGRLLEKHIKFWDVTPQMELLSNCEQNEAYVIGKKGKAFAIYFTNGGKATLDLSNESGTFDVAWISVISGIEVDTFQGGGKAMSLVEGGGNVEIVAPYKGGWIAVLSKQ